MSSHWPHTVAHSCLHLYKTETEDTCTAVLWMFEAVTVRRSAVYDLWFQLISRHLARALPTSTFETMKSNSSGYQDFCDAQLVSRQLIMQ